MEANSALGLKKNESQIATVTQQQTKPLTDIFRDGDCIIYGRRISYKAPSFWFCDELSGITMGGVVPDDLWLNRGDIKVVWKKSSCSFLIPVAIHAHVTRDHALAERIYDVLNSWIGTNQKENEVNWASPLAVSLRLTAWSYVAFLLQPLWSAEWTECICEALKRKTAYILSHLEFQGIESNHFAGNISALAIFSLLWRTNDDDLLCFANKHLQRIARKQITKDGVQFEFSLHYHRLVCEMLAVPYFLSLIQRNKIGFESEYRAKLIRMIGVLKNAVNGKGVLPQIGDNDSEIILCAALERNTGGVITPFLDMCDHFLDGRYQAFSKTDNLILISGYGFIRQDVPACPANTNNGSNAFYASPGWFFLRRKPCDITMVCGSIGMAGVGAHDHCHCNQLLLSVDGDEVVVDPGTGCYTRDITIRNRLRSATSHSTVDLGENQRHWHENLSDLWRTRNPWKADIVCVGNDSFVMKCKHTAYVHTRTVAIEDNRIKVVDAVSVSEKLFQRWVLHPHIRIERVSVYELRCICGSRSVLFRGGKEWTVEPGIYSPSFGIIEDTNILVQAGHTSLSCEFIIAEY